MKYVGAAASALTLFEAGVGGAAAASYETDTVPAGETRNYSVGGGETLENLLIDITADGAEVEIQARGSDWTIRNVGVRGVSTTDKFEGQWATILFEGTGTIENCYLGDGSADGIQKAGIGNYMSHSGHVEVRNCYIANWADNGIYTAHAADNGGGTVHLQDCYFHDNNVGQIRLAADGSSADGCVVHNTNGVPSLDSGQVNSMGVFTYYGDSSQVIEINNCDIEVTTDNTNGTADAFNSNDRWGDGNMTTISVTNTEYRGTVDGPYVEFGSGNGNEPDLTPPPGVPMDATEAASGSDEQSSTDEHVITIVEESGSKVSYEFSVDGDLEKSTDDGASINDDDVIEGSTATGWVWGGKDSYRSTGQLTAFWSNGPVTVLFDGEEVDTAPLSTDLPNYVTISSDHKKTDYQLSVSGDIEKSTDNGANINGNDVIEGSTATGQVWRGKDSYRFSGTVTDVSIDGDGSVSIHHNSEG